MACGIGTTSGTITLLSELTVPLPEPKTAYLPNATTKRTGANTKRGFGLPVAYWTFPLLTPAERNQLKTFCAGASATIYITTKLDDDTYDDFAAVMNWPDDDTDRWYGTRKEIIIEFVNLVAV